MRGSVERQSEQLFSSAGSRLFSSVASRSPSVERKFPFSRLDSLDLSDAAPLHVKCLVISNLHSTGGGILSLGSGASCPRATTCNSVSVSCYGPPRVRSSAVHRDAAVGIQTFVRLSVLAARRQTPTLTWEGAVSVRKKATQSSDGVLYGITYSADASEIVLISEIFFITRLGCCSCAQHATVSAGSFLWSFIPVVRKLGGGQPHNGVTAPHAVPPYCPRRKGAFFDGARGAL